MNLPVYMPSLTGNEKRYVNECVDSTWISSKGSFISRFEIEFTKYLNVNSASTVSNGTVALHLALMALGIGPGDEVIVPTLTYIASVNAIAYVGATPVFVDSLYDTWNVDPLDVANKITDKTKAIIIVHLYGNPCAMEKLSEICLDRNIKIIEDAAEAFGSSYKGTYTGSLGDIATFSFFGNKTITTGEGGMVTSNNRELIDRVAQLKNQSVSKEKEYWHDEIGYNYRMTNIAAAIGLAQLENADQILEQKRLIADWYQSFLIDAPVKFQTIEQYSSSSYWMVSIVFEKENTRDSIRAFLSSKGVETRPVFPPAHTMPAFKKDKIFPMLNR